MADKHKLEGMTVLELRRYAKEQGITLSNLTTKAAIIERIAQALPSKPEPQEQPVHPARQPSAAPSRRATIIADDGDEQAPAPRAPRASVSADKTKTSTGKTKPVFTLQGSRAWHNPQPFTQTQTQTQRYAPQITQGINTLPREGGPVDTSLYPTVRPRPSAPRTVSRFGPASQAPQGPEAQPGPREGRAYTASRPSPERSAYQSSAFKSVLPAHQREPFVEPAAAEELDIPEPSFAPVEPARDNGLSAQVSDLLAAGELGDGAGVLEIQQDGYGFLRSGNLLPGRNDIYVSGTQIRRFRLRNGDYLVGKTRSQRENDRYAAMLYITSINGEEIDSPARMGATEDAHPRREFDELTPTYPDRLIRLSSREENDLVLRLIDLFIPIGFGQRAMIVAAPKAGKTTILKKIALSLKRNHPDVHSMMLLVDERPEEVTDLKESVGGDIFYSTFDEPPENHAKVSELTLERAMRFVEQGRDVVILLDSLTRMSRAYNTLMPGSARVMTGGLAAGAMNKPKRFFGAARNLKEGGSLTIIATALVDTGSRMDSVIFEEFKGTGNMELTLDRTLSERRLFPAVSLLKSGTRHEELLLSEKEREVAAKVRDRFAMSSEQEAISLVLSMLEKSRDNDEFVARYDDWMRLMRGSSM
ncbi:MAG: transcription termination factor Rho [Clostridiales bacterium]|nr:transcription termination factor Rho [Clostridiales bacterium]